jgi:glucose-6-phosphate isomerase
MRSLFASEPDRAKAMATTYQKKLYFDFSRQLLSHSHFKTLIAKVSDTVSPKIKDMFSGEIVNFTEKRPVMHMALRAHQTDVYAKEEGDCLTGSIGTLNL